MTRATSQLLRSLAKETRVPDMETGIFAQLLRSLAKETRVPDMETGIFALLCLSLTQAQHNTESMGSN